MYRIRIDHNVYERHPVTREPFTLVSAMRELYGCGSMYDAGGVAVLRADGTPVVIGAGSASAVTYAPTGRTVNRRRARHLVTSHACRTDAHGKCNGWTYGAAQPYPCQCHCRAYGEGCGPRRYPRARTTTDTYTGDRLRFRETVAVVHDGLVVNLPAVDGMYLAVTKVRPALLAELNPGIPADTLHRLSNPPDLLPPLPRTSRTATR